MNILAIETSCDETSASIIKENSGALEVASNIVSSQIDIHKAYGGVVPEIAARHHVKNIIPVILESLATASLSSQEIDLIAVTSGPGLITSLIVGVEAAKSLAVAWNKPVMQVNHMYAHLAANFLYFNLPQAPSFKQGVGNNQFPVIALIVSGGHTEIILVEDYNKFKKIGQTVDDAAGEAFDKVAKLLNLGYPGGPIVSAEADKFKIQNHQKQIKSKPQKLSSNLFFPRPMIDSPNFNFSFSGLKTAVLYAVQKMTQEEIKKKIPEICYEFQAAAVAVLVKKTIKAAEKFSAKTVFLAGGVAANRKLRQELETAVKNKNLEFFVPDFKYCTDNASMIGIAAYYLAKENMPDLDNWRSIKADPNWELE
ncbi:MAG: tRNA (adenosine(37)-N6)-threonylcarbamoyltransferase complex transferase subunit TsaD [Candidatus Buchananbacteria bacterium]|nr:tRNA (adenosine(37)-N6)-threonylcarbamoyltransferase complex transferase subunit TsaD [Candidatus Buchananbacteria bacterium]